jgi:hypothetical protein
VHGLIQRPAGYAGKSAQINVPENSRANFSASPLEPNSHKTTISLLFPVEINRNGSMCRVFNQQRISSTQATTSWPGNLTSTVATWWVAKANGVSSIAAGVFIGTVSAAMAKKIQAGGAIGA